MYITEAKVLAMLTLGLGSLVFGMLPACFAEQARRKYPLLMSCLLCFGAGVLLSTSLIHMLPEARASLPKYAEALLCIGFFLVYFVDEIVHFFYGTEGFHSKTRTDYGTNERTGLLENHSAVEDERPCCGDAGNPRMCHVSHTAPCEKSSSGVIGLLGALFVHSVLEGLAIGLQETSSQVLLLLAAVSSHKFVVGFCLGAELVGNVGEGRWRHFLSILLFSLGSVVGIGLGTGLELVESIKDSLAIPVMQSLAAGTLLYVTVSEVLPRERAAWHEGTRCSGLAQLTSVITGFTTMYLMTMFLDFD